MCAEWQRPKEIPFPNVWRRFEGKKLINGAPRKYWVQDISDDQMDDVIEIMCNKFTKDEALCKYLKLTEDPAAVEEFAKVWRKYAKQRLGLICLTKNENGETEIVGVNMTARNYKGEQPDYSQIKTEKIKFVMAWLDYIYQRVDIYEKFNIDDHLTALGLYVDPKFRGDGVGVEILKTRRELCKAVGIKATFTLFTSNRSQAVARKAGFQDVVNVTFEELEKHDPKLVLPGITEVSDSQRYMYILYD
ncbi:uncharacterized protein LOC109607629 [Aethina tumida]|uniref:uncharacterized protein LOC109607629 n=1 Tax=Aethina tumida TaxID=116153 RepID=UPI00096B1377|nr:uncharacterized protein LOC109607629 [Aethina tumida]